MKSQKGVTLIALIVYLIGITIAMSILALISDNFFSNASYIADTGRYISEFNKFNMYFIEDVKESTDFLSFTDTEIVFNDGVTYTYQASPDNGIYRNKVKICSHILFCKFDKRTELDMESGILKTIVTVDMVLVGSNNYTTSVDYVLKYW